MTDAQRKSPDVPEGYRSLTLEEKQGQYVEGAFFWDVHESEWDTSELFYMGNLREGCYAETGDRVIIPSSTGLNLLSDQCHTAALKWWTDPVTGQNLERNKGELLALIHSEVSECLEGERTGRMDDHLPHRKMAEVELADALIRIFDYAGGFGYDLQGAFEEKMAYNKTRQDHQLEARMAEGGKKF